MRGTEPVGRRLRDRFQRELRDIVRRDHFGAPGRDRAERALHALARPSRRCDAVGDPRRLSRRPRRVRVADRASIDPDATFVFIDDEDIPDDATAFDMVGVELSHHGDDCTFETMLRVYGLDDPVLWDLARIVHEADLADDRYEAPEARARRRVSRPDTDTPRNEILAVTHRLFDGLYEYRRRALLLGRDPA